MLRVLYGVWLIKLGLYVYDGKDASSNPMLSRIVTWPLGPGARPLTSWKIL